MTNPYRDLILSTIRNAIDNAQGVLEMHVHNKDWADATETVNHIHNLRQAHHSVYDPDYIPMLVVNLEH